ncbi:nuclear transport factor 2 family protein [uncultured Maritimibacter sp.]|jgi:hypothetical protein|uniref:nuclear transport factor 2 family protein n=1 Tax=uncultured Maritimibacter sp. TaxID=991866 RepID=UPI00260F2910|nr:nuclear transport factor 2 family protein [uncultured Maritimibacter sp.]
MKLMTTATAALFALALPALAEGTFPPQHWASNSGIVDVQPNGSVWENENAVDALRIQEAFNRWGIFYDEGRSDLIPSLFTEDGKVVSTLGSAEPIAENQGYEAIAAYVDRSLESQLDQRRHAMSDFLIDELTETTAKATAYGTVIKAADGISVGALVIYTGDLVKGEDGVWKFQTLTIGIDDYAGNLAN